MQYKGLLLLDRFEDFILSWKTSTTRCELLSFEFLSHCKQIKTRKQQKDRCTEIFCGLKRLVINIVSFGLSSLKAIALFPIFFSDEHDS